MQDKDYFIPETEFRICGKGNIMKKRIRKKLHTGEFADLRFTLTGKITGVPSGETDSFMEELFQTVSGCGCCLNGTVGPDNFDLEVITGPLGTENDLRREQLLAALKNNPHVQDLNATELARQQHCGVFRKN